MSDRAVHQRAVDDDVHLPDVDADTPAEPRDAAVVHDVPLDEDPGLPDVVAEPHLVSATDEQRRDFLEQQDDMGPGRGTDTTDDPQDLEREEILPVETPYESAEQDYSPAALDARERVQDGATLWRVGTTNRSQTLEGQFWALEHPAQPNYVQEYGVPEENVAAADFVESATMRPGQHFITRPAEPYGDHPGGGIEVVVPPGGVIGRSFSIVDGKDLNERD